MNDMDVLTFCGFLKKAREKELEEKLYLQWCAMLPTFSKFISFNEFMDKATGRNIDRRDADEIIAEINQDIQKMKESRRDGS